MGTKVIHVSDISGREGTGDELGRLVIHQHPDFQQVPITLDVLPEEIKTLEAATQLVMLEYFELSGGLQGLDFLREHVERDGDLLEVRVLMDDQPTQLIPRALAPGDIRDVNDLCSH